MRAHTAYCVRVCVRVCVPVLPCTDLKSRKADAGLPDTFGNRVTRGSDRIKIKSCAVTIRFVPCLFYFNAKFIASPRVFYEFKHSVHR